VEGFGRALEALDQDLEPMLTQMTNRYLLVLAADHGNDPTFAGSDHTREYIPVLAHSPAFTHAGTRDLGTRASFADVGATVFESLTGRTVDAFGLAGQSFLKELA
jgi:phosphopentomutase